MIFDTITMTVCTVLVVLASASILADTFFKKIRTDKNDCNISDKEQYPTVSVVIVADNTADELKKNLPVFLSQDYHANYEVIVAVEKDEDGTEDILKEFANYPNLYATFVPDSSRYMSRRKLAITLGVKAASNEWILLTDATCRPASSEWINRMARNCSKDTNMVIGYGNYDSETGVSKTFYRFHQEYAQLLEASHGHAYSTSGKNLMFRKSMFMSGYGFQGNLKYIRGEYDFLVNKYATNGIIRIETNPSSFIIDKAPSKKEWRNMNVFYHETSRHLSRSFIHKSRFYLDMLAFHLCLLASLTSIIYSIGTQCWGVLILSVLALLLPCFSRTYHATKAIRLFNMAIPKWKVLPLEFYLVWTNLKYSIIHKFSDKYTFISHKS